MGFTDDANLCDAPSQKPPASLGRGRVTEKILNESILSFFIAWRFDPAAIAHNSLRFARTEVEDGVNFGRDVISSIAVVLAIFPIVTHYKK